MMNFSKVRFIVVEKATKEALLFFPNYNKIRIKRMDFNIFQIFITSLFAQNLSSWTPEIQFKRKSGSVDLNWSGRNGTDDYIDGLSEYEKFMYPSFVSSSKLYPDILDSLLEPGLKNFKQTI